MSAPLALIAAYLVVQLGIGVWVSRRIETEADYLIAGRSLGYSLATFSIFATWFGAETIVGSAGSVYREGVTFAAGSPSLLETRRQPYQAHFNMHRHPRISPAVYQVSITGPYSPAGPGDSTPSPG